MRALTSTLLTAQKSPNRVPKFRLTFSKAGEDNVVIEQDRILYPSGEESANSQKATFVFDNSGGYFTSLDLKGWAVSIERGLVNAAGTAEYDTMPPMKVKSQHLDSRPGILHCTMSFEGNPNLVSRQKASKNYFNHWSNTKTVKALITEIADGDAVDTELTEEQTVNDSFSHVYGASNGYCGVALTIVNRTITKIGFYLKKVGAPTGTTVTFRIDQDAGGSTGLASVTFPIASLTTSLAWCEATLATPVLINERVWVAVVYSGGDSSNYVGVAYNTTVPKLNESLVLQGAAAVSDEWEDAGQDCAYRYKYTAGTGTGVTNGIPCFQHCHDAGQAYEVVYDSEDSLIDTYCPADSFQIVEGGSRLDAVNTLLRFTTCVGIWQADGKFHVFVPTITGIVYDSQYELDNRILIDVGSEATNRASFLLAAYTVIDLANPANASGVLTSIDVWAGTNITGLRVGTFYLVSGTTYKCRDSVSIGAVTAGSKQTFQTRLTVVAGDFLGCYFDTGTLERDTTGGSGYMYVSGEYIDADDSTSYTSGANAAISLYASRVASHEFFAKSIRNSLVSPNKITVNSYDEDGVLEYSGSATDSTSFAIIPIEDFIRARCTSIAQCQSIAAAMIAQLVRNGQQGSATVPINLGAEIYDYVKVTDSRQSDSRTGNLGYFRWWYIPSKGYNMTFSFGQYVSRAIGGPPSPPRYKTAGNSLQDTQDEVNYLTEADNTRTDDLTLADKKLNYLLGENEDTRKDPVTVTKIVMQIASAIKGFIKNLVEDTTPQLGGTLDPNSQTIGDATHIAPEGWFTKLYTAAYTFFAVSANELSVNVPNTAHNDSVSVALWRHGDTPYLDMEAHKIAILADPTADQDAANRRYVGYRSLITSASANVKNSYDDAASTTSVTPVELHKMTVKTYLAGVRVYCDLQTDSAPYIAHYQVYVNDVAVGVDQTNNTTWATFSDDLTNIVPGDKIQIFAWVATADKQTSIRNFRLAFDVAADATNG